MSLPLHSEYQSIINSSYNRAIDMINDKQSPEIIQPHANLPTLLEIKITETQFTIVKERPCIGTPIQSLLSDVDKQLIPGLLIQSEEINKLSTLLTLQKTELKSRVTINIQDIDSFKNISPNNLIHFKKITDFNNSEDINIFNFDNFMPIVDKINKCRELLLSNNLINHKVDCSIYNDVFFISDIHSDLRKFISLLHSGGFVELDNFDPYNEIDSDFISKIKWIKNNSLLVIIGDLVDGTRVSKINDNKINMGTVNDKIGNFEVLLHILIYNLRLQALLLNSNILFTYGNHDLFAIFKDSNGYEDYVSPETKKYFYNSMSLRANVLKYFYALSPYIVLQLSTPNNSREILCVHGGLHTKDGTNIFNKDEIINFFKFQEILSLTGVFGIDIYRESTYADQNKSDNILFDNQFKSLTEYTYYNEFKSKTTNLIGLYQKYIFSAENNTYLLISRFYTSSDQEAVCKSIQDFGHDIKMIVVGHCTTNGYESLKNIMNTNIDLYKDCDRFGEHKISKGCVVTNCSDSQNPGAPTLAFVDTAMSSAFRSRNISSIGTIDVNLSDKDKDDTSSANRDRINEMLHLHHDPLLGGTNRYYNVISRLVLPTNSSHEIILYQAASKAEHNIKYRKQMKYLKYKLKYYYLVQKS